jgi:D-beta-D-heptose 7-phosphate kinase/D-beta-D-heptose 1-phosphate adenosyltransferase
LNKIISMSEILSTINRQRAESIAQQFADKRLLVLGDFMLDEFIFGRVRRISPEAPVPVVEVERQMLALGGAGNVVNNLVALGARPLPLGVVGDDADAERMRQVFTGIGVATDGLIADGSRPTTLKTRIIAHNQQVVRADRESRKATSPEVEDRLVEIFTDELMTADAVVVSDYGKGLLTDRLLNLTLNAARAHNMMVCLDPKRRNFAAYQPLTMITPNHQEAAEAAGVVIENEATLIEAGRRILADVGCQAALVTRGEEGMSLFTEDGAVTHIPTVAREVDDVTGAGDTVSATLTLALATGASFREAAVMANHAAGVVVGKLGTATVSREELLKTIG